jgi:short subunit fatty acids transporter
MERESPVTDASKRNLARLPQKNTSSAALRSRIGLVSSALNWCAF